MSELQMTASAIASARQLPASPSVLRGMCHHSFEIALAPVALTPWRRSQRVMSAAELGAAHPRLDKDGSLRPSPLMNEK